MTLRFGSVCSGIEAASVAWEPLGWEPVFYSEIDPFPCALLEHRFPDVPNLGDMNGFREWPDAKIDLLVGGTPCQSFSVAGLRKGLEDPRGNLALVYLGVAARYRPRWILWENVPGVLSSGGGRDFGSFLGGLVELGYGVAYRVLDAQFFGVPQRRRRVFVVGHLGDWRRAAEVLFEPESLRRYPPPSREAGEGLAPCITARPDGGRSGRDSERDGALIAHSLRADGFDASEDGTGRGTPLVPICDDISPALAARDGKGSRPEASGSTVIAFDTTQITSAQNRSNPKPGDPSHPLAAGAHPPAIAFNLRGRDGGAMPELSDLASLRAASGGSSRSYVAVGCDVYNGDETGDIAATLNAANGAPNHSGPKILHTVMAPTLTAANDPSRSPQSEEVTRQVSAVYGASSAVRRLTPRECERLQGFPDDWTLIPYRGKPAADGNRYKALGNSMAIPTMRWLGERIAASEARNARPGTPLAEPPTAENTP